MMLLFLIVAFLFILFTFIGLVLRYSLKPAKEEKIENLIKIYDNNMIFLKIHDKLQYHDLIPIDYKRSIQWKIEIEQKIYEKIAEVGTIYLATDENKHIIILFDYFKYRFNCYEDRFKNKKCYVLGLRPDSLFTIKHGKDKLLVCDARHVNINKEMDGI